MLILLLNICIHAILGIKLLKKEGKMVALMVVYSENGALETRFGSKPLLCAFYILFLTARSSYVLSSLKNKRIGEKINLSLQFRDVITDCCLIAGVHDSPF